MRHILMGAALLAACVHQPVSEKTSPSPGTRPVDIVSLSDIAPEIPLEIRYTTRHNFVGAPIDGYLAQKCLLTKPAAEALKAAQSEFAQYGLSIKIYDCYRPQSAVNHFVRWAKDLKDSMMKAEFYPDVPKDKLFKEGYIAEKSGHSRASTIDLTLIPVGVPPSRAYRPGEKLFDCRLPQKKRFPDSSLDMGTGYDCFDPKSHTAHPHLTGQQRRNRLLLKAVMEKHGFQNYELEWWHFTLKGEPYPNTYFDFPIQ